MAEDDFQRLLDSMPKIAEAVKALPVELQQSAYNDLVAAFRGTSPIDSQPRSSTPPASDVGTAAVDDEEPEDDVQPQTAKTPRKARARRALPRNKWTPARHIDFWPTDKQSFKDLVEQKQPKTIDQKNLIAVYWFEQIAELEEIGVSQVLAAYKSVDWHEPAYPDNALQATASRYHWIDTKNMKKITTTPSGRNAVKSTPMAKK